MDLMVITELVRFTIIVPLFFSRLWISHKYSNHYNTTDGVLTVAIDINLGKPCLIDEMKFFRSSSPSLSPDDIHWYVSENEIHGDSVNWPDASTYFTNYIDGQTINGIEPYKPNVDDRWIWRHNYLDLPIEYQQTPYFETLNMTYRVGQYIRLYIRGSGQYVGGILIQIFGKPLTESVSTSIDINNLTFKTGDYVDTDNTIQNLITTPSISDSPLYHYTWITENQSIKYVLSEQLDKTIFS